MVVDVSKLPPDYRREFILFEGKFIDEVIYDFQSIQVIDNYIHWSSHKLALFKSRADFIRNFAIPTWNQDTQIFNTFEEVKNYAESLRGDLFAYSESL